MDSYKNYLKRSLTSWRIVVIPLLTIARIFYGYRWLKSGIGKLVWFTDGKNNSYGFIANMIENMRTDRGDPFRIGRIFAEIADTVFQNMPALTDALVVILEILIGLLLIIGFRLVWTLIVALFLNLQFFAAGSTNNFGYVITNLIIIKWSELFDLLGLDGFLRSRKE